MYEVKMMGDYRYVRTHDGAYVVIKGALAELHKVLFEFDEAPTTISVNLQDGISIKADEPTRPCGRIC